MPVQRMSDGTLVTGLDPAKVPAYAEIPATGLYVKNRLSGQPSLPKNPWLQLVANRRIEKEPNGAIRGKFLQGTPNLLYRPGGLLYKP